jgi:hypothetical protein
MLGKRSPGTSPCRTSGARRVAALSGLPVARANPGAECHKLRSSPSTGPRRARKFQGAACAAWPGPGHGSPKPPFGPGCAGTNVRQARSGAPMAVIPESPIMMGHGRPQQTNRPGCYRDPSPAFTAEDARGHPRPQEPAASPDSPNPISCVRVGPGSSRPILAILLAGRTLGYIPPPRRHSDTCAHQQQGLGGWGSQIATTDRSRLRKRRRSDFREENRPKKRP